MNRSIQCGKPAPGDAKTSVFPSGIYTDSRVENMGISTDFQRRKICGPGDGLCEKSINSDLILSYRASCRDLVPSLGTPGEIRGG
jgi:hypothetical protein